MKYTRYVMKIKFNYIPDIILQTYFIKKKILFKIIKYSVTCGRKYTIPNASKTFNFN